jgi:signal transduction histidine kinase
MQQKDIAFGIMICLMFISLIVLFCIILIQLYLQKIKKYNAKIYENEILFQKTLTQSIIETQEHLLKSISQDLHDDAGQQLTVINFQLENLKLDFPDCYKDLNPISQSVNKLSEALRGISHALNTNWLEKKGLINAIKNEVKRINKNKLIAVNLTIHSENKSFSGNEQIVLFRIFQETINNILKHAKANTINIEIEAYPLFKIKIIDNGIGFEVDKLKDSSNSIGIQNCLSRANLINYDFIIESIINNGTTITIIEKI